MSNRPSWITAPAGSSGRGTTRSRSMVLGAGPLMTGGQLGDPAVRPGGGGVITLCKTNPILAVFWQRTRIRRGHEPNPGGPCGCDLRFQIWIHGGGETGSLRGECAKQSQFRRFQAGNAGWTEKQSQSKPICRPQGGSGGWRHFSGVGVERWDFAGIMAHSRKNGMLNLLWETH